MQLTSLNRAVLILIFSTLFLLTRVPGLGTDVINPDAVNWHTRSEQFMNGLKFQQFEKTYQHYHPGVTLMWITGPSVELLKQLPQFEKSYNINTYTVFHFFAKYVLVSVHLILSVIAIFVLTKVLELQSQLFESKSKLSKKIDPFVMSLILVSLFSFEPFIIGNSRLLHLDILLTLFLFIALSLSYLLVLNFNWKTGVITGIFLGLSFLTKSVAIGGVVFVLCFGGAIIYKKTDKDVLLKFLGLVFGSFVVTTVLLFPAMWVDPVYVLNEIFSEAERVGIRKGHGQIFFGEYSRDPGLLFYMLVFLIKSSPVMIFGILMYLVSLYEKSLSTEQNLAQKLKSKILTVISHFRRSNTLITKINDFIEIVLRRYVFTQNPFIIYLAVFYLGYIFVMGIPTKKIDRYMLPVFPFLSLIGIYGYYYLYEKIKEKSFFLLFGFMIFSFIILPIYRIFPYYFTYTSPLLLNSTNANRIIAQKPFGVGITELKELLLISYPGYPDIGMIDTKPIRTVYPNSKVYDIRVAGTTDYDLIILGVNETMPEKVYDGAASFVFDKSLIINDLEYWRIYVKEI